MDINIQVKDLWWPLTKSWNITMVHRIFIEDDVEKVIELCVPQRGEDELVLILKAFGKFSVKIAFHAQNVYYFNQDETKI